MMSKQHDFPIWGAHAAGVSVSAASRNNDLAEPARHAIASASAEASHEGGFTGAKTTNTDVVFRIRFKHGLGADEVPMPISKVCLPGKITLTPAGIYA